MRGLAIQGTLLLLLVTLLAACTASSRSGDTPSADTPLLAGQPAVQPELPAASRVDDEAGALAGRTVTVLGGIFERDKDRFLASMAVFEERTGIDVVYDEAARGFPEFVQLQLEDGTPPDVILFPQPGLMADLARRGHLLDLTEFLDTDQLNGNYAQTWLELGAVDGRLVGVWYRASVKSLVWYPAPEFEEAGYEIPQTWEELLHLSDQIVADGRTPWCIGMANEPIASGWVGTDWIEEIMLRTAGADAYDRWVAGELRFDSPEVKRAFTIFGDIVFDPAYVKGGATAVQTTFFGDSPNPLFDDPPGCWLHRQANFITNFFPEQVQGNLSEHVNAFHLPPIDADRGFPVLGAGDVASITSSRPEVIAFLNFLITAEAAEVWAKTGGFLSPNRSVPLSWYPDEITRAQADILVNAELFRFDGSDLMPGMVGTGSFWTEMVNWVGGQDLETTLRAIDATWPHN